MLKIRSTLSLSVWTQKRKQNSVVYPLYGQGNVEISDTLAVMRNIDRST